MHKYGLAGKRGLSGKKLRDMQNKVELEMIRLQKAAVVAK